MKTIYNIGITLLLFTSPHAWSQKLNSQQAKIQIIPLTELEKEKFNDKFYEWEIAAYPDMSQYLITGTLRFNHDNLNCYYSIQTIDTTNSSNCISIEDYSSLGDDKIGKLKSLENKNVMGYKMPREGKDILIAISAFFPWEHISSRILNAIPINNEIQFAITLVIDGESIKDKITYIVNPYLYYHVQSYSCGEIDIHYSGYSEKTYKEENMVVVKYFFNYKLENSIELCSDFPLGQIKGLQRKLLNYGFFLIDGNTQQIF